MAKKLESGETYFKIEDGSIADALKEARYWIEHGMSSADYRDKQYQESDAFMRQLVY